MVAVGQIRSRAAAETTLSWHNGLGSERGHRLYKKVQWSCQVLTLAAISRSIVIAEAAKYPTLTANGFDWYALTGSKHHTKQDQQEDREYLWSGTGLLQITYAIQFSKENRISPDINSYGQKHVIERWSTTRGDHKYISNGCAILGLSIAGYEVIPIDNSPNCLFQWKGHQ